MHLLYCRLSCIITLYFFGNKIEQKVGQPITGVQRNLDDVAMKRMVHHHIPLRLVY